MRGASAKAGAKDRVDQVSSEVKIVPRVVVQETYSLWEMGG